MSNPVSTKRASRRTAVSDATPPPIYSQPPPVEVVQQLNRPCVSDPGAKTCCFYCTLEFDASQAVVIPVLSEPLYQADAPIEGTGCYCSAGCALASLLHQNLPRTIKQEKISRLQYLYSPNPEKGVMVREAPDPHRVLAKFQGHLTPEQYRQLAPSNLYTRTREVPIVSRVPELGEENCHKIMGYMGGDFNWKHTRLIVRQNPNIKYGLQLDSV
jgi:hypothetical protein